MDVRDSLDYLYANNLAPFHLKAYADISPTLDGALGLLVRRRPELHWRRRRSCAVLASAGTARGVPGWAVAALLLTKRGCSLASAFHPVDLPCAFMLRLRLLPLLLFATLVLAGMWPGAAQDVLNGIAAVVNNEVITFSEVRELVGSKEQSIRQ